MSISITFIVNENDQSQAVTFDADPSTTMDEVVALASSIGPVPDPPFTVKCGPVSIFDTSIPTTGSFTLSALGITSNATLTLVLGSPPSVLPPKRPTSQTLDQHQPPQKQPSPPLPKGHITAEDVIRASQMNTQQQPQSPPRAQGNANGGRRGIITADDVLNAFRQRPASPPQQRPQGFGFAPRENHMIKTADEFISYVKARPELLEKLSRNIPKIADAILNDNKKDVQKYLDIINERIELQQKARENPYDPEVQKKIEQMIHMENIAKNLEETYSENPELLLGVTSPHIRCKVNGVEVIALVDTGAQVSVMSPAVAKKCNLTWLIDTRIKGVMRGVGQAESVGRIHGTMIEIGGVALKCSITIVDSGADFIFGCDQLRRHRCVIDLDKNALRVGSIEVPFVAEKDLPKKEILGEDSDTN